eukprot:scaffold108764_cov24-Tisochrysis_lutea.AAC.2
MHMRAHLHHSVRPALQNLQPAPGQRALEPWAFCVGGDDQIIAPHNQQHALGNLHSAHRQGLGPIYMGASGLLRWSG